MLTVKILLEKLPCFEFIGNKETCLKEILPLDIHNQKDDALFWCDEKHVDSIAKIQHGTIICPKSALNLQLSPHINLIVAENPRRYFSEVIACFFNNPPIRQGIAKTAIIHESSIIGNNCYIGEHVVIEEDCIIGDNCFIDHHTVLHYGTVVKNNVKIGCHNSIGGFGYGYEKNAQGHYEPIPHLGNVVIEEQVEICNNSCIDRAVLGSTIIGKNVKVSNLVHIGHGVQIGENSLIIANAMIAGSVTIGSNVWIAPSVSVMNKICIGDNAVAGLSSVILKSVREDTVVVGNPARELVK